MKKHPSIYTLVDAFRKEQKKTEDSLVKSRSGVVNKPRGKYVALDKRINEIMLDYQREKYAKTHEALALLKIKNFSS